MRPLWAGIILAVALAAIYAPAAGHGFIKDDVVWILNSRVSSPGAVAALFERDLGFYRPLVSLSFAIDHSLHRLDPRGYGLTNVILLFGAAAAVAWLGTSLGLSAGAGLGAAALWAFNFHGINMGVLWISGRTSLLLTLFAACSAAAFARGRPLVAALLWACALFSKEEAIVLPLVLAAWAMADLKVGATSIRPGGAASTPAGGATSTRPGGAAWSRNGNRGAGLQPGPCLPFVLVLVAYAILRARTSAFLPWTAPEYYRPSFDVALLAENVMEYLDRGATWMIVPTIVLALILQERPRWTPGVRRIVIAGVIWFTAGYALTVFVPVRSSLYACFPSVGGALAAAAVAADLWQRAGRARRRAIVTALLLPFLLWPVYASRNRRWVELADLSSSALADLRTALAAHPAAERIVLLDDRSTRANLANTFGTLLPEAARLLTGRDLEILVEPPVDGQPPAGAAASEPDLRLQLRGGRLVPVPSGR